jgi:hypothetical protein
VKTASFGSTLIHSTGAIEPIAPPGQRLNEAGRLGRVAECRAKLTDGVIHALLEVDECLAAPERPLQILP